MRQGKLATRAASIALATLLCGSVTATHAQESVRIGTSSAGSTFYSLTAGAGEVVRKHTGLNVTVQPLGGSAANVFGLGAGKVEMALVNAYAALTGFNGTDVFKGKQVDLRVIVKAHASYRGMFVRKDAGITGIIDLKGKTLIGERRPLPELKLITDNLLNMAKLTRSDVKVVSTTNLKQALDAISAGSVNAMLLAFDGKSATVQRLMREGKVNFLYLSKAERDELLSKLPKSLFPDTFEANRFPGQDKPVHLIGMDTYFVARANVSDDVAYKVAKALMDNTAEFATYYPAARRWVASHSLERPTLPFHPGAIRYFKEKGLWTPALEKAQERLLKR